ncbi:MAG: undecaprenyl diphosphate synthase [Gammaproteobacteria bacterium]|nr:MAG: undecaprenyl diphosphate synthase [Gammaproteobacteria bacterium]TND07100.1 MAG: undecaprenyl diphosphate synthase [Gammaproteobacteria bacterium]
MLHKPSQSDPSPPNDVIPRHVAIIMDGNGRWAKQRNMPRIAGHRAGVEAARKIVQICGKKGVEVLTLFAFSSENWRRPATEVNLLMELFLTALRRESKKLDKNNARLIVIGDRAAFAPKLQQEIARAEALTGDNTGLTIAIAANYGGRWDIVQAAQKLVRKIQSGELAAEQVTEHSIEAELAMYGFPEPDLFIRSGGEQRISNFLLWQLAYTELYFTDILWPDFDVAALDSAFSSYASRQRRYGRTGDQVQVKGA